MVQIYIHDKPYEVKEDQNLLHACLELGFDIPYFCWHPALHSVGACRACAVKQFRDDKDTRGRIVMSCMTPVTENMRISIDDPETRQFRAGIIELLMINHPHDCPVCDEGGECHLQDMTLMTGHVYRRYPFKKRTYRNQNLGPHINHEMNRCIHCYRCVRFYRDYAGGRDFAAFASHHNVYFGRHQEGTLQNAFSGNLVEVCPTGVFTDKTFQRHFTRAWDLQTAPSICVHCGLGCNTIPGERYGMLRRIRNRYNGEVNGYFLCDRGRFGYEFVNHPQRLRGPLSTSGGGDHPAPGSEEERAADLASLLRPGARMMGIGSPRSSLEANYALRTLVGPDSFYAGMSETECGLVAEAISILKTGPAPAASLHDAALADAVLILGEDVMNTAPLLALALRQAVRNRPLARVKEMKIPDWDDTIVRVAMQEDRGPLFIATPASTALDELAERTCRAAPDDLARLGFAVASVLNKTAPPVPDLSEEMLALAATIATGLREAQRPLVVSGVSSGSMAIIHAAADIAWALCSEGKPAALCLTMPECNSFGLGLLETKDLGKAFAAAAEEKINTLIILENDLFRRAETEQVHKFLESADRVIVIDSVASETARHADTLLPAAVWAESTGTFVSSEGRAQRFFKVFAPQDGIKESVNWLRTMLSNSGRWEGEKWQNVNDITKAMAAERSDFGPLSRTAPPPEYRSVGQKIPRQSHRYSGRTAMTADRDVHEQKPPDDPDSPLAFSMEGYGGTPPPPLLARYWFPGWNSVQALNKFQAGIGGPLRKGDPGWRLIAPATAAPAYFTDIPDAFSAADKEWLFVPYHHLFGSEELSSLAAGIAELAPHPYLALQKTDAERLGLQEGDEARVTLRNSADSRRLAVRIDSSLPAGVAGLPVGLSGQPWAPLPAWGRIVKAEKETP